MTTNLKSAFQVSVLMLLMVLAIGCSGGKSDPSVPSVSDTPQADSIYTPSADSLAGEYSLDLNSDTVSGEIIPASRNSSIDVTKIVRVTVDSLEWDPVDRNWDIVLILYNPREYSVYRPWMVFTSLGEQRLLNQDHFIWISDGFGTPATRVPLKEIDKASPKLFSKFSSERMHLVLHWPETVNSFASIKFFIDVSWPGFRNHPDIVSVSAKQKQWTPANFRFELSARVLDLQTPPPGVPRMDAWVDLSSLGGPEKLHFDGLKTSEDATVEVVLPYMERKVLTLHVVDWQGYGIEQDFVLGNDAPVCQEGRDIAIGDVDGDGALDFTQRFLSTQQEVDEVWSHLQRADPPPVISPDEAFLLLSPGFLSKKGYDYYKSISADCVAVVPDFTGDGVPDLSVSWSFSGPDDDCDDSDPDFASPYLMKAYVVPHVLEKNTLITASNKLASCPDGTCTTFRQLMSGTTSVAGTPGIHVARTQSELNLLWSVLSAPGVAPELALNEVALMVVESSQSPDGSLVDIRCVSHAGGGGGGAGGSLLIDYSLRSPDSSCSVPPSSGSPFSCVAIPDNPLFQDVSTLKDNPLYRCANDGCLPALDLASGDNSALRSPYFDVICSQTSWRAFWGLHQPGTTPPPVDFSSKQVVVVILGEQPTTGYSVSLDCLSLGTDATGQPILDVAVTEYEPDPATCTIDPTPTSPFVFAVVNSMMVDGYDLGKQKKTLACD